MASTILMCEPRYFDVVYQINPWMTREQAVDVKLAKQQWQTLRHTLQTIGATVVEVPPQKEWPDMVFTANAAFIYQHQAYLAHFHHPERQGEREYFKAWLQTAGLQICGDEPGDYQQTATGAAYAGPFFEGAGDALMVGEILVAGFGFRSDARVFPRLRAMGISHLIECELVDAHFYHLDTCFCPLNARQALWWPGAFSKKSQQALAAAGIELLAVSEQEAKRFACNSIVIDKQLVMPAGCEQTEKLVGQHGFQVHFVPMSEFMKAGGACKCLSLAV